MKNRLVVLAGSAALASLLSLSPSIAGPAPCELYEQLCSHRDLLVGTFEGFHSADCRETVRRVALSGSEQHLAPMHSIALRLCQGGTLRGTGHNALALEVLQTMRDLGCDRAVLYQGLSAHLDAPSLAYCSGRVLISELPSNLRPFIEGLHADCPTDRRGTLNSLLNELEQQEDFVAEFEDLDSDHDRAAFLYKWSAMGWSADPRFGCTRSVNLFGGRHPFSMWAKKELRAASAEQPWFFVQCLSEMTPASDLGARDAVSPQQVAAFKDHAASFLHEGARGTWADLGR